MSDLPDWDLRDAYEEKCTELDRLRAELDGMEQVAQAHLDTAGEWKADNDRLRAEVAKQQWQPIATAPKDDTAVLIANGKTFPACMRVAYWDDETEEPYKWHVEDAAKGFNHHKDWPTHWMPLPDPPKEAEE